VSTTAEPTCAPKHRLQPGHAAAARGKHQRWRSEHRHAGGERLKRLTLLIDPSATVQAVQFPVTDPAGSVAEMLGVVRARDIPPPV
jgi:hypothetical protein